MKRPHTSCLQNEDWSFHRRACCNREEIGHVQFLFVNTISACRHIFGQNVSNFGLVISNPAYRLAVAWADGAQQFVIIDSEDRLHIASSWLKFLTDVGRSPNTVKSYGSRVAAYLSWTAQTSDWRAATLSHLGLWRRSVATFTIAKANGVTAVRNDKTVNLYVTALRSFYEWADAEGFLTTDVASRMTQIRYFAGGTAAGGEHGAYRKVVTDALKTVPSSEEGHPEWVDDEQARRSLLSLKLPARDRFLVDLLYNTGIRVGEALSLFTRDLHFGGGSRALGCTKIDPHFHVRTNNPVENGARAKGLERVMFVTDNLIDRYIDYLLERRSLGHEDKSQHVFVNLYAHVGGAARGRAMSYSGAAAVIKKCSKRVGFDLTGPHILRHTFATRLVNGIECEPQPLDVVQALMGHRSIASTRVYTHVLESAKKAAMRSVDSRPFDLGSLR